MVLLLISSKLYTTDQSIIHFECMVQDIWSFELLSTLQFDILLIMFEVRTHVTVY